MPGERSPEYVDTGWHVRGDLAVILVPKMRPWLSRIASDMSTVVETPTPIILRRYRLAAPCPYVGEKAWYTWWVWLDDHGQGWADTTVERVVQGSH